MQTYRVADWMSTPALTIEPTTTLAEAQRVMDEHGVRRLPVLKHGKLVGIVSKGDLRAAQPSAATTLSVYEWRALLDRVTVTECMCREPVTITPEAPVLRAAQQMLAHKVSGLPVVLDGRVVGVITESDLFRLLIADLTGSAADTLRGTVVCPHCSTVLRWRANHALGPDDVCWNCHKHLWPKATIHYEIPEPDPKGAQR